MNDLNVLNRAKRNSHPQATRRFIPAHKENKRETGRAKKFAQAQQTKEAPRYEEVHGGEEIKGGGSVKIEDQVAKKLYLLAVVIVLP